jgi:serine/threonine protein kinase
MTNSRAQTQFGHYQLRAMLGRGGMGEVYEAYDTVKTRTVALKLLDPELGKDATYQERFRRESQSAARLQEPHVIPIHDWGQIDGVLYIDMRLVQGHDLRAVLNKGGAIGAHRAVAIVDGIAAALDAAHADGLIHRDVKPENILITTNNFPYLVDFGIARSVADLGLTTQGSTVGSYAYMAPERFDNRHVDPRADVYALACVLYECLTGSIPYPADSISSSIGAHLTAPVPRPSQVLPTVPASFDGVIAIGLAKNRDARFRTAGELASAARQALTEPNAATMINTLNRGQQNPTAMSDAAVTQIAVHYAAIPPRQKSNTVIALVAVLVVAVLGLAVLAGWLFAGKTTTAPAASPSAPGTQPISATSYRPEPQSRSAPATPTTAPIVGTVTGADNQGFQMASAPRCDSTDQAAFIGRTSKSLIVVCENGSGRYYYEGVRVSDYAGITLQNAYPDASGSGFDVINPRDNTRYEVTPTALTISRDGELLASEAMIESAHP